MCESMGDIMMTASVFIYSQLSRLHGKNSLAEKFGLIFSSSPSRQSIWLSPRLSACKHTPVLQRKLSPLQPGTHTRRTQCERGDFEAAQGWFVSVCLIYARSTSRHFGPHSRPCRHKSGWGTHTWCSHTWNHILHLEHQRGPRFKEKGKTQNHHISLVSSFHFNIWQINWTFFEIVFVTSRRSRHEMLPQHLCHQTSSP